MSDGHHDAVVHVPEETLDNTAKPKKPSYYSQLYVIPAVDAVEAGKGQLEISVNQGKVPNNVQMQGAGRFVVLSVDKMITYYHSF